MCALRSSGRARAADRLRRRGRAGRSRACPRRCRSSAGRRHWRGTRRGRRARRTPDGAGIAASVPPTVPRRRSCRRRPAGRGTGSKHGSGRRPAQRGWHCRIQSRLGEWRGLRHGCRGGFTRVRQRHAPGIRELAPVDRRVVAVVGVAVPDADADVAVVGCCCMQAEHLQQDGQLVTVVPPGTFDVGVVLALALVGRVGPMPQPRVGRETRTVRTSPAAATARPWRRSNRQPTGPSTQPANTLCVPNRTLHCHTAVKIYRHIPLKVTT